MAARVIMVIAVAAVAAAVLLVALPPDIGMVIATGNCGAAARLTADDIGGATADEQIRLGGILAGCPAEEVAAQSRMLAGIEYLPDAGLTPDDPIILPVTLDRRLTTSNVGPGGCEITLDGIGTERSYGSGRDLYYLEATVRALPGAEYCELNGVDWALDHVHRDGRGMKWDARGGTPDGRYVLLDVQVRVNHTERLSDLEDQHMFAAWHTGLGNRFWYNVVDPAGIAGGAADRTLFDAPRWDFVPGGPREQKWVIGADIENTYREKTVYVRDGGFWGLFGQGSWLYEDRPRRAEVVEMQFLDTGDIPGGGGMVRFQEYDAYEWRYLAVGGP